MSDHEVNHTTTITSHHERPFLYPWNRRLRHLHGISLRNLDITPNAHRRSRGKTITDDDIPSNLTSPTKLLRRNGPEGLHHSHSSSDLTSKTTQSSAHATKPTTTLKTTEGKARPPAKIRRRSTLHWSSSNPRTRQEKLEDVASIRLADTWFSLHCHAVEEPIYISEVMEKCMNPSFGAFDLEHIGPETARRDDCVLKVWAKNDKMDRYSLLVEMDLCLRSLQYIGRNLENFHHPLSQNTILFHLSDGIYTSFTDLAPESTHSVLHLEDSPDTTLVTGSYDALMQLANLDDCIQDALNTRAKLEHEINSILASTRLSETNSNHLAERKQQILGIRRALDTERKQVNALKKKKKETASSIHRRQEEIRSQLMAMSEAKQHSGDLVQTTKAVQTTLSEIQENSTGQIRRIGETMLKIFPIEPIRGKPLHFSICNIALPNSVFDDTNRDEVAAALGFTARMVHQLSLYLSMPLPYPIDCSSSDAFINDSISKSLSERQFPLHPTNIAYKFEYGVFLLNKNIEFLMSRSNLRALDIRHTLPNLKYLLYVLTAGTGQLPSRKAGGIKGLLAGRMTPSLSRRTSEESVNNNSDYLRRQISADHRRNKSPTSLQANKEKDMDDEDPFYMPVLGNTYLPHRRSHLRDGG